MAAANGLLTFCQVIFGLDGISDPSHPNPTETSLSRIFRNKPEIVPSTNVMMMNDNFEGSEGGRIAWSSRTIKNMRVEMMAGDESRW